MHSYPGGPVQTKLIQNCLFSTQNSDLYAAVFKENTSEIAVFDTSEPTSAESLAGVPGGDVKFIHKLISDNQNNDYLAVLAKNDLLFYEVKG